MNLVEGNATELNIIKDQNKLHVFNFGEDPVMKVGVR